MRNLSSSKSESWCAATIRKKKKWERGAGYDKAASQIAGEKVEGGGAVAQATVPDSGIWAPRLKERLLAVKLRKMCYCKKYNYCAKIGRVNEYEIERRTWPLERLVIRGAAQLLGPQTHRKDGRFASRGGN